jgi:all-trans-retinol 13,14-reductase
MTQNAWDTIVVGAGVGGLTAAASLVKAGLRVLVLDRNPHPGGTAYVYRRKGFAFPMGPLGFSHPGLVKEILGELGPFNDLKLHRVHYRIRAFGLDLPLASPYPNLIKEMARAFPSDAPGVERFFRDVQNMTSGSEGRDLQKEPPLAGNINEISAVEYLDSRIQDRRLRRILGSIGTRDPYSGLPLLAAMWNLMVDQGIWYPESGLGPFCDRLAGAVTRDKGGLGEIRLGTEVAMIRVERGKVLGVTLKDGTKIESTAVISNGDYKTTFLKLVDPQGIPPQWTHAVANAKQTGSVLQVCLGVDRGQADLSSFHQASRLIYKRDPGDRQEDRWPWKEAEVDPDMLAQQEIEVSLWSREDPTLAAEGQAVVVIRTEADYGHFSKYRTGWRKRVPGYLEYKNRLGRALLREAEKLVPGLEEAVLVMDVSTPLTFEDQGGRAGGAVAGWSWDHQDFRDTTPRELIRTPVRGLYMAGYQAYSALFLGGIPTAMESGRRAAESVLKGLGPMEEIRIPGVE